jgi:hypothetical protein
LLEASKSKKAFVDYSHNLSNGCQYLAKCKALNKREEIWWINHTAASVVCVEDGVYVKTASNIIAFEWILALLCLDEEEERDKRYEQNRSLCHIC